MKLYRYIKSLPLEQKIKIGCKESNGWWYIGTAEDLKEHSDIYDSKLKKTCETYFKNKRNAFSKRLTLGTPGGYAASVVNSKNWEKSLTVEGYHTWLEGWFKSVVRSKKELDKLGSAVSNYVRLGVREVQDFYPADSAVDDGYICIIIDGIERGLYWTSDEAKELPAVGIAMSDEEEETEEDNKEVTDVA